MRKIILISLVLVFTFCSFNISSKSQDAGDVAVGIFLGAIEDDIIKDAALESFKLSKELAAAAKEAKFTKSIRPFIHSLKKNTRAIVNASKNLSPERCRGVSSNRGEAIQNLIAEVEKFQENLCSNVNTRLIDPTFHPLAQKICFAGSPDFQDCVCMHKPPLAECEKGQKEPECFSDKDFANLFERLSRLFDTDAEILIKDENNNGFPDLCENNKKK